MHTNQCSYTWVGKEFFEFVEVYMEDGLGMTGFSVVSLGWGKTALLLLRSPRMENIELVELYTG